jgi:hypothetical protein
MGCTTTHIAGSLMQNITNLLEITDTFETSPDAKLCTGFALRIVNL